MHLPFFITAGLTLGAAFGLPLQDGAPATTSTEAPEPQESYPGDDLGGPLKVGDTEITENQIKRFLIYGPCRSAMEWRRINAIIEDEISRRIAGYDDELAAWEAIKESGADPGPKPFRYTREYFQIDEDEFAQHFDEKMERFRRRYPSLDQENETRRAYRSVEWYRRELRQEMYFDRCFVPDDTNFWPDLTFEAMREEAGEILIDDFKESYERRIAFYETALAEWQAKVDAGEDAGPKPRMGQEDSMYRSILRQIVRDAVLGVTDCKSSIDGLSPDLLCTMDFDWDGEPELALTVDEIWQDVKRFVNRHEIDQARRFLALTEATRQRLDSESQLISEEEAAVHLEEIKSKFGTNIFGLGQMAVGAHQFPSVESYAAYMPLLESYRRSVEPQMESPPEGGLAPVLREHLPMANQVMGLAKVDAEVLLVAAIDMNTYQWIEDGWATARKKAEWLKSEIEKNGVAYAEYRKQRMEAAAEGKEFKPEEELMQPHDFWSRLLDEHCDFWDPPPPLEGKPGSDHAYKKLGRFGERTRNDMRSLIGESPYSNFLNGGLLTDAIYFKTPIGSVAGPMRGPHGWYLAKVIKRTPPVRPLNINDERHVDILKDDWVRLSFIDFAHEALEAAEVTGLTPLGKPGGSK